MFGDKFIVQFPDGFSDNSSEIRNL